MEKLLSQIQISLFEIIGYILPGYLVIALFSSFFQEIPTSLLTSPTALVIVLAYLIGLTIHSISTINLPLTDLLWTIYHHFKEKEADRSSVKKPRTKRGAFFLQLKSFIYQLEKYSKKQNNSKNLANNHIQSNIDKIAPKSFKLKGLDYYYIKQLLFNKRKDELDSFEHLSYQKALSRSLSTISLLSPILILYIRLTAQFSLYFGSHTFYYKHLDIHLIILLLLLWRIFLNRAQFYKSYEGGIINASYIISIVTNDNDD